MLKWLSNTFGVRTATVALDPARSAFQPAKLQKLPLSVRIVPLDSHPMPHAKLLWLTGKSGSAAVVGSANCSAAAWLVPAKNGGNIESVAVFDECEESSFRACLDACPEKSAVIPEDVPGLGKIQQSYGGANEDAIRLLELSCNAQLGELRATVAAPIGSDAAVQVEISGFRMPLRCGDSEGFLWLGPMPDLSNGWTHFGRLVVHYSAQRTEYSGLMWLNEEDELQHSIRGRQLSNAIGNLSRPPSTTSEQQKLLQELAQLASALFSDRCAFPDPVMGRGDRPADTEHQPRRAVDPDELVRSIAQLDEHHGASSGQPAGGFGLPIVGVMRVLFPPIDQPDETELGEESDEEKQQRGRDEKPHKPALMPHHEPPPGKFRSRLIAQMDEFVRRLVEPEFADRCTATQLVQAAAFPIAVAMKALDGRWIDHDTADSWTFKVVDALFRVARTGKPELGGGLLAIVRERYKREHRAEVFETVLGDGRLWLVVSAALDRAGTKQRGGLERALALTDVFHEPVLWSAVDTSRIGVLLSRMQGADGKGALLAARKSADVVREIEARLAGNATHYADRQRDDWHAAGDPLWKNGIGFGRAEEASPIQTGARLNIYLRRRASVVVVVPTYYVNLRIAATRDGELLQLLDQVGPCWPGHKPVRLVDIC